MGIKKNNRGVSLVEVITAVAVLGIAIPPLVSLFNEVASRTPDSLYQSVAVHEANSLMEEIVSKAFEDPEFGPGSFGAEEILRSQFDDIDDFDGYTGGSLVSSVPVAVGGPAVGVGTSISASPVNGITLSAEIHNVSAADTDPDSPLPDGATGYKRITVKAAWTVGGGGEVRFKTLRTNVPEVILDGGPLDEAGSAGSATVSSWDSFDIALINPTDSPLEIESVQVDADRATPFLTELRFSKDYGPMYFGWIGIVTLPSPELRPFLLPPSFVTIEPNSFIQTRVDFLWAPTPGPITFTVTYTFTDGTSSILTIPMVWS